MDKLLTIAVPAYNAAAFLDKCLSSFISPVMDAIEVIVVNDGSTDETPDIAARFVAAYPDTYRLVNKENGGHGSGINVAAGLAKGKYFRVVDADDWVITQNLPDYLDALEKTDADAVLTHFHTIDIRTEERLAYINRGAPYDEELTPETILPIMKRAACWFSIHTLAYRTAFYQKLGLRLSEKIFYEDTEYAVLPFAQCAKLRLLDMFLYEYRIGDVAQSVSIENYSKRYTHLEQVLKRLVGAYAEPEGCSAAADAFLEARIAKLLVTYEKVLLIYLPDKKKARDEAKSIRAYIATIKPAILHKTKLKHFGLLCANMLKVSPQRTEALYAVITKRRK